MTLTPAERKHRMPHGAHREVARAEGVADSYVTAVMNGTAMPKSEKAKQRVRRIQVALAAQLGLPVDDVFPDEPDAEEEVSPCLASASR